MLTQNFCNPLGPFPLSLIQIFSGLLLFIILTVLIVPTVAAGPGEDLEEH